MSVDILNGDEVAREGDFNLRQTWVNTHDGNTRLEPWQNSFISFTYGGKYIEDFGLNVVNFNSRKQLIPYANFNDITTNYDVLDGGLYWGTHFTEYKFSAELATDGMTEQQLQDFQIWFAPGNIRTLVYMEHWNRAIEARVAAVPDIQVIPFEETVEKSLGGSTFTIKTTLYKGEITLNFVADEPFWHSRTAYFEDVALSTDDTKIIYEDNIPWIDMFDQVEDPLTVIDNFIIGQEHDNYLEWKNSNDMLETLVATVNNSVYTKTIEPITTLSVSLNTSLNLYYAGTAPSAPKLSFQINPVIKGTLEPDTSSEGKTYIYFPCNNYASHDRQYNSIVIGQSKLNFTTPSVWTGYNEAIYIINTMIKDGVPVEQVRQAFIDNIHNPYSRAWAIGCLAWICANNNNSAVTIDNETVKWLDDNNNFVVASGVIGKMRQLMRLFLVENNPEHESDNSLGFIGTFYYNFNTGVFTGDIQCRVFSVAQFVYSESGWNVYVAQFEDVEVTDNAISNITTIQENVGDMIRSGHLVIKEHTGYNSEGYITPDECLKVQLIDELLGAANATEDLVVLNNFNIDYVYKY